MTNQEIVWIPSFMVVIINNYPEEFMEKDLLLYSANNPLL